MAFVPFAYGILILVVGTLAIAVVALRPRWEKARRQRSREVSRTGT